VNYDGELKIIVTIQDLTDSVNYKKMQLEQKDEKDSQFKIKRELDHVFTKHANALSNMAKDLPAQLNKLPSIKNFKLSSAEMFDTFSRYSDLVDIRLAQFTPKLMRFSPMDLYNDLADQDKGPTDKISFEMEKEMPRFVIGEFFRVNYLIVRLL